MAYSKVSMDAIFVGKIQINEVMSPPLQVACQYIKVSGIKQIVAMKYRNPAKVNGGISASPHLIITKEVDQRKVTSRACSIAVQRSSPDLDSDIIIKSNPD